MEKQAQQKQIFVSLPIPAELKQEVRKRAFAKERSVSAQIRWYIQQGIEQEEKSET